MKSIKKFFAVTAVAATVFATTPATTAHAVGLNELFSKADAALKTVKSVDLKGNLTVAFDQNGTKVNFANVNFETELDLENVQGEGKVEIASQLSPSAQKQAFQLKDDTLSTQTGDKDWTKADYSAQRNQFKTALQNAMKEAYKDLTPEQEATLGQYFEIKEDGEDYVYALKQGIDGKKFYEDNKATFERVKEQALKQSEANGQSVSDQQKATFDKLFSADTMEKFFASNPKVEIRYNKSTFLVSKVTLDVNLKPADFLPAQSAQGAPGNIAVQANLEAKDYNQPIELENH
ncbi:MULTISPECIES: hypothetical protein [Abiotrophia]|uniref:hypothetical protein n=1 Tax=Abiotrophia TaxID=46123 RepID=UPI001CAD65C5|nr:hypothetical protein [Abiotrophia sp.]MBF0936113.1 hypothetical protein [Abiotrophia sp.]